MVKRSCASSSGKVMDSYGQLRSSLNDAFGGVRKLSVAMVVKNRTKGAFLAGLRAHSSTIQKETARAQPQEAEACVRTGNDTVLIPEGAASREELLNDQDLLNESISLRTDHPVGAGRGSVQCAVVPGARVLGGRCRGTDSCPSALRRPSTRETRCREESDAMAAACAMSRIGWAYTIRLCQSPSQSLPGVMPRHRQ